MSERYDDTSPDLRSEGIDPTQGQGQFNRDPTDRDPYFTGSDIRSESRGRTQGQGLDDDSTTRSSQFGSRPGGDPFQATNQSADPDFGRNDPSYDQTYPSGTGGQDYGQQDQRRQGEQTASDRVPLQTGQERFEPSGNYGTPSGAVPNPRLDDDDGKIRGDGGFGGKPTIPERVLGTTEKILGKATRNTRLYERGEEHKAGGY